MGDGEQLSWMLVNNIELLINLCDEAPVFELISSAHRNSATSGLIIKAISTKCADNPDVNLYTKMIYVYNLNFVRFSQFSKQNV